MMCEAKKDIPITLQVEKVIDEGENLKTLFFNYSLSAKPGQFVMLWLPGIGQKPFSISYQDNKTFGITIFGVGDFTNKLLKIKKGDRLGIQGPYGTGYSLAGKNIALVGGGCGSASLALLADELKSKGKNVHFIIGAKNKNGLLYGQRYSKDKKLALLSCTDDGSFGFKGFTTQALTDLLKCQNSESSEHAQKPQFLTKEKIDMIYTCGPEIMMKKVINISDEFNIPCEISLERYMKCGFGLCGQCVVDPLGIRICKEGPVLSKETVKRITEFGHYKRDASGKKINY